MPLKHYRCEYLSLPKQCLRLELDTPRNKNRDEWGGEDAKLGNEWRNVVANNSFKVLHNRGKLSGAWRIMKKTTMETPGRKSLRKPALRLSTDGTLPLLATKLQNTNTKNQKWEEAAASSRSGV